MYIDFKITTWERIHIPSEYSKKALKLLKDKTIECSSDLYNEFDGDKLTLEELHDVEEQMTVSENDGCSTIEMFDDEGNSIFENGEPQSIIKSLYYTVEKQLEYIDEVGETNGWKTITVYTIENNLPKQFCQFEAQLENSSEEEIQTYLDNNGFDSEYNFVLL